MSSRTGPRGGGWTRQAADDSLPSQEGGSARRSDSRCALGCVSSSHVLFEPEGRHDASILHFLTAAARSSRGGPQLSAKAWVRGLRSIAWVAAGTVLCAPSAFAAFEESNVPVAVKALYCDSNP